MSTHAVRLLALVLTLLPLASTTYAQCTETSTVLCLNQDRFTVEVTWQDFSGNSGPGTVVPFGSDDSGLFWFFDPDNWEMLVKVLDGCGVNNRFWVFAAATTNVGYELRVTDTVTGTVKRYTNPVGVQAPATTDTDAFATCSPNDGLPPDPGPANDTTLEGIDSDGDGIRDDVQRYIELTYTDSPETKSALTQITRTLQAAIIDANSRQASLNHMTQATRNIECLLSIRPDDAYSVGGLLAAEILDTEQRGLAYFDYQRNLSSGVFPMRKPSEWADSCTSTSNSTAHIALKGTGSSCIGGSTKVYYGNGILTTEIGAAASLGVLQLNLINRAPEEFAEAEFDLAYNETSGPAADLWESLKQEINTNFSQFYRMLLGIEQMPDFLRDLFLNAVANQDRAALVGNADLRGHVTNYRRDIIEGKKVILVAHSQGNFFANQAFANLNPEEQESFGIVSVANPDDFVAGGGPYTTLFEDLVIIAVNAVVDALPPNTSNGLSILLNDPTGHGFVLAYMIPGDDSHQKIISDAIAVSRRISQPEGRGEDGIITVALTWGEQPDVDLHAFEPNGTHVYYANLIGPSGRLDVDDTTSFGPEHYTVSCETLETGTYEIAVNYFAGYAPETASISIEAGLLIRNFVVPLPEALGFSGDDDPRHIANIVVSGDIDSGFVFSIE